MPKGLSEPASFFSPDLFSVSSSSSYGIRVNSSIDIRPLADVCSCRLHALYFMSWCKGCVLRFHISCVGGQTACRVTWYIIVRLSSEMRIFIL